jgi:homocysteine S-methyltransferase
MRRREAAVPDEPRRKFTAIVEVVPPGGPDPAALLTDLESLDGLPIDGFSIATNPLARPRMSALALCALVQQRTGKQATLHCTTRDHNRLSLQSLLWGARALRIRTVLAATGDLVALGDAAGTSTVRDVDVYGLVRMARDTGLRAGVVFDPHPESDGFERAVRRLERKAEAGAQFVATQPVYDETSALALIASIEHIHLPVMLSILPLRTARHAEFLHHRVSGIVVPEAVRARIAYAPDPIQAGVTNARDLLAVARETFAGAYLMPPFGHYEVLGQLLEE